jgi:hypothetical protein
MAPRKVTPITLPIPLKAMTDCGAILGRRGAGKSGTGRVLLEHELDAGHRSCVIDPKGDWYGIRLTKEGKPSRFQIPVIGGQRADLPVTEDMGARIGEIVATHKDSFVVDLSGFHVAGMRRFMSAFAESLFMHNRHPLTLFVDEADQLAPQRVAADQAKLLHHMESLIRQGRQRGIFMWMLTQRPAVLNKNLLSQAETLIAMKMTGPHDRKAIREWMDAHDPETAARVEANLSNLNVGEAWAWVPGADFLERVQFPLFSTFDSGRTPQHGDPVNETDLPPLDTKALAQALQGDGDEEMVDELKEARARIGRLETRIELMRHDARQAEIRETALLDLVVGIQNTIGAVIGSPRIMALPPGTDLADYLMVLDADGVVRPIPRVGDRRPMIAAGRARMREAKLPKPEEKKRGR